MMLKILETSYEYRGVKFTLPGELDNPPGIYLIDMIEDAIDTLLKERDEETGDFQMRAIYRKEIITENVVSYNVRVIKV